MLQLLPRSLRRLGLVLGALVMLGLATGWVPGAPTAPPGALAIHEGNEPSTTDSGPWGGRN
jgi:hypothetical protein